MRTHRVLVVDDDAGLRATIGEVLADDGYEVRVAADGAEALSQLDAWAPDLIILDMLMPGLDAHAFRAAQRERHDQSPPVILVSAVPNLPQAAANLDAAAVVTKPFRLDDFLRQVQRALGQ